MNTTMTLTEMNRNPSAAVRLARKEGQVCVTDRGRAVAFILPAEKVEAILETLEVLGDPDAMKTIRAYERGKVAMKDVSCLDDKG